MRTSYLEQNICTDLNFNIFLYFCIKQSLLGIFYPSCLRLCTSCSKTSIDCLLLQHMCVGGRLEKRHNDNHFRIPSCYCYPLPYTVMSTGLTGPFFFPTSNRGPWEVGVAVEVFSPRIESASLFQEEKKR